MVGGASKQQTIPDFERTEAAPVTGRPAAPCCLGSTFVGSRPVARRRPSKAAFISLVKSRVPVRAARAAAWATLETLDVVCDCRFVAAAVKSAGAIIQPTRQPVMA